MPEQDLLTETVEKTTETVGQTKPLDTKTATVEEMRAEIERLQKSADNKAQEAARVHKKLEAYEKAEQAKKESEMTETDKLKKLVADLEQKTKQHEHQDAQRAAAEKMGLPLAFADRLKGETPEELEADAEKFKAALPQTKQPPPKVNPTNPGGASTAETEEQKRARLLGPSTLTLDPEFIKAKGGGVFYSEG